MGVLPAKGAWRRGAPAPAAAPPLDDDAALALVPLKKLSVGLLPAEVPARKVDDTRQVILPACP